MATYDLLMLAILVGLTLYGYFKGMAWQIAYVASFVASYFLAVRFADRIAPQITFVNPPANKFVAMAIIYAGASLGIWMLFRVVRKMIDSVKMEGFDHQMGALIGFGRGVLWCVGVTFVALTMVPLPQGAKQQIVNTKSGYYIARLIDETDALFPPEVHQVVGPYLDRLGNELQGSPQPSSLFQQQSTPAGWPAGEAPAQQPAAPAATPSWGQSAPAAPSSPSGWPQASGSAPQQPAAPSASDFGWPTSTNNAPPATPAQQVTWPQWDR
ncbi:Colicin V production protein [Planctomycetes bacterium MalM25]|nr:Colicin V production protein [Planctomycetes bacterium MalM25]